MLQVAILGDVTTNGDFLDMAEPGPLDVKLVAQARIERMIVPSNTLKRFIQLETEREPGIPYYGASHMWDAVR